MAVQCGCLGILALRGDEASELAVANSHRFFETFEEHVASIEHSRVGANKARISVPYSGTWAGVAGLGRAVAVRQPIDVG